MHVDDAVHVCIIKKKKNQQKKWNFSKGGLIKGNNSKKLLVGQVRLLLIFSAA